MAGGSLVTQSALFLDDICLIHDGTLRAFQLKPDQVPATLVEWSVEVISPATCEDYFKVALGNGSHSSIQSVFPEHNLHLDFDEIEIGGHYWNPKLDALQAQIDDLDSTYAQDAEVVAAFATQIAAAGDVFNLVEAKVLVETTRATAAEDVNAAAVVTEKDRAEAAEVVLTTAVSAEASTARAAESANATAVSDEETRAEAAELTLTNAVSAEASTARAAESANATAVSDEETRAEAAELTLTNAVSAEASTARAAESANAALVATEEARALVAEQANATNINNIVVGASSSLDQLTEIVAAYSAADTTILQNVNSRVLSSAPVMTGQCQAQGGVQTTDIAGNDSLKLRSIVNGNVEIEPHGSGTVEVSKALNCAAAVSATAFSQGGQAVLDQSSSVQDLSDVTAVGSGAIISVAERTQVAYVDVTSSVQGLLNAKYDTATATTALAAAQTDRALVRTEFAQADATAAAFNLAARGTIQSDVDQNEADGDADRAAIRTEFAQADVAAAAFDLAARATIQADVDQNEADGDADRAAIRTEFAQADVAAATFNLAARATMQNDVDQNEADGDADRAAIRTGFAQADVSAATFNLSARATIQNDVDQNEADGDADRAAIRTEFALADTNAATFNLAARATIQNDVDVNEAAADTDRALIRTQYLAADVVVQTQVTANASAITGKQDALSSASGLNLNGDNAAIGIAAPSGGTKLTVKGQTHFIKSSSTQVLKIHSGNTIEASSAVHDAIDLRVHGTGGVRMSQYSGGVNEFASFKHAGSTIASNLTLTASQINFTNLPASDPGVAGRLYRDAGGIVKISL